MRKSNFDTFTQSQFGAIDTFTQSQFGATPAPSPAPAPTPSPAPAPAPSPSPASQFKHVRYTRFTLTETTNLYFNVYFAVKGTKKFSNKSYYQVLLKDETTNKFITVSLPPGASNDLSKWDITKPYYANWNQLSLPKGNYLVYIRFIIDPSETSDITFKEPSPLTVYIKKYEKKTQFTLTETNNVTLNVKFAVKGNFKVSDSYYQLYLNDITTTPAKRITISPTKPKQDVLSTWNISKPFNMDFNTVVLPKGKYELTGQILYNSSDTIDITFTGISPVTVNASKITTPEKALEPGVPKIIEQKVQQPIQTVLVPAKTPNTPSFFDKYKIQIIIGSVLIAGIGFYQFKIRKTKRSYSRFSY